MERFDVIGDVHGCATELKDLLTGLDYRPDASGVYRHPERIAVFVGDLIDSGPGQLEVLQVVKGMVDAGTAKVVMGNHEFNAIGWATTHPETGQPLRPHTDSNRAQHEAFLALPADERAYWIDWLRTLPLWLDLGGIRVVHACWHPASMRAVEEATGSNRLTAVEHYVEAHRKGSDLYEAIEVLLKGPEIPLPDHGMVAYYDHEAKKPRTRARVRWWDHNATSLPALAALDGVRLENRDAYPAYEPRDVHPQYLDYVYTDAVPLFYGHYSWRWEHAVNESTAYTACVDLSAIRGGTLVAYRWSGEPEIRVENYVHHDPAACGWTS